MEKDEIFELDQDYEEYMGGYDVKEIEIIDELSKLFQN